MNRDYRRIAPGKMSGSTADRIIELLYRRFGDPFDPRGPETIGAQLRGPTIYEGPGGTVPPIIDNRPLTPRRDRR